MPIIRIEYDDARLTDSEVLVIAQALQKIVVEETGIEDVSVYANTARIKVAIAPLEAFVEMSASKIGSLDALFDALKTRVGAWKQETGFAHPVNLTVIPMHWKFDTGI